MAWLNMAFMACTFMCGSLPKIAPKVVKNFKNMFSRDDVMTMNDRLAIFYGDHPTNLNYTGLSVDTNGLLDNTTAVFKFGDGYEATGNLTGHSAHLPHGIGYGNFSVEGDTGKWITVDMQQGSPDVAEFYQWLAAAAADGNITNEELEQAVEILKAEA